MNAPESTFKEEAYHQSIHKMAENIPPPPFANIAPHVIDGPAMVFPAGVQRDHMEYYPSLTYPARIPHYHDVRVACAFDGRRNGCTQTKVKAEEDHPDRHELFLLGDGEKKVEVEAVTQIANAAIFKFNKEDHTLANMLRDKLCRLEHVTFAAYKVPHPLFATFQLRVHTDGEISPKEAVVQACQELVQELQVLDQEFTKEFELRKITGQGPSAGLDI